MTLFKYVVFDKNGRETKGQIDAHTKDAAITSLQSRGYIISSIKGAEEKTFLERSVTLGGVKNKEIVILSKQLATLFDAQVSAIRIFRMLAEESKNEIIRNALTSIADDISDGSSVANAMVKHPKVFSSFYVNMIAAGEEAGKMSQTFNYLSDYLERSYAVTSKVKGAMIYPSFVLGVFVIVMYLMLTMVIPKIAEMLVSNGGDLPMATKIVIAVSDFLVDYGFIFIGLLVIGGFFLFRYIQTPVGKESYDRFKIELPLFGSLFKELFIARVAGNFTMMLRSGVAMVKTIENTSKVVDNVVYEKILMDVADDVRGGEALSKAFSKHEEFSSLFVQMTRVGEESGKLSDILETMSKFYEKEVLNRVSAMVSLIEPIMITALGGGVGLLLASVLLPIYSVTNTAI
jgi:type IV pilus assembly protein PilC